MKNKCLILIIKICIFYLKKWTAGLAKPNSEVDPCGEASDTFSSHADITSSANIPKKFHHLALQRICKLNI